MKDTLGKKLFIYFICLFVCFFEREKSQICKNWVPGKLRKVTLSPGVEPEGGARSSMESSEAEQQRRRACETTPFSLQALTLHNSTARLPLSCEQVKLVKYFLCNQV